MADPVSKARGTGTHTARPPSAWLARLGRVRNDPTRLIGIVLAVVLGYLVVAPIVTIVVDAFRVSSLDAIRTGAERGSWTVEHVARVFSSETGDKVFWTPLGNTLLVGSAATALALVFGLGLALLVARTDIRGRKYLGMLLIIPYMLPSQAFATAWSTVFRNRRTGGAQGMLEVIGLNPPDWLAYGPVPIAICLALNYFPFAFLLFSNALNKIDLRLVEAARSLGAGQLRTWGRILLPLLLPTTMSVLLLTAARTLGTFATPYVLGSPKGYYLLSTSLYSSIYSGETGTSAVLALVLATVGMLMLLIDIVFVRNVKRFVTVGGKGGGGDVMRLRALRLPFTVVAWAVFLVAAVAPLAIMFLSTITKSMGRFHAENFTLEYWLGDAGVFANAAIGRALLSTLLIAAGAALACAVVGMFVGYVVARLPGTFLSGLLRQISFFPYLIPGLAFAAALLSLFAVPRGPVPALYGTNWLLVVVMAVAYLPYASRAAISSMAQIGHEPEEAAGVLGAGFWRRLLTIVLPLQRGALVTALVLPFISGMKELSLVVMLVTPGTETLTTQSLRFLDQGSPHLANASILIIGLIVMVTVFVIQRVTRVNIANGIGG